MKKLIILLILLTFSLFSNEFEISKEGVKAEKLTAVKPNGFTPLVTVSTNFILNKNESFIGKENGSYITTGLDFNGKFDIFHNNHDIRLSVAVSEQFSRTPVLERFTKSADSIKSDLSYLYYINNVFGPYSKAAIETTLLSSYYDTVDEATYEKPDSSIKTTNSMKLIPAFKPITIRESIGAFYNPINKKEINFEVRGGFGALHTMADNAYFIDDNKETSVIELKEYDSFNQGGASFLANFKGIISLNTAISYEAGIEILMPFLYEDTQKRSSTELTNYDMYINLSTQLTSWLSLNYQLKVLKQPQLLDEFQIQHNFTISLNYLLIGKK